MAGRSVATIAAALSLLAPAAAGAGPLSLAALDALSVALRCRSFCNSPVGRDACVAACPPLQPSWEKDGEAPIEALDYELALVEYWDGGRKEAICEAVVRMPDGTSLEAVRPKPLCAPPVDCKATPSPAQCADADGDGLPLWQEIEAGTSDQQRDTLCRSNVDCRFVEACGFVFGHGRMLCAARPCGEEGCKAFRLEAASVTNEEVIVHVVFEYAPSPVTVLDLKLDYSFEVLELLDARPLALLDAAGKSVAVSHLADRKLRVVVAGALSTAPVPYGPIVELVFWRKDSTRQASVGFSDDPVHRRYSMAPEQGAAQGDLVGDGSWGGDIPIGVGDPAGPRALLSYTFDDPANPLVKNVPSASALCSLLAGCANGDKTHGLLAVVQEGMVAGGEPVEGVRGKGWYLRGTQDHLRFPLTHEKAEERSFTLSGWFYAEGSYTGGPSAPQVLFAHLSKDEFTQMGLRLDRRDSGTVDLVWFEGQYDLAASVAVTIREKVPVLTWTHVGVSYDDATRQVRFFVDGEEAGQAQTADRIGCPELSPSFAVHTIGDIATSTTDRPGSGVVYYARTVNGLSRIERMDPLGLAVEPVLVSPQYSYRDPDYNAGVDRLVYVSNESGSYEVWMSDRQGQNRKQVSYGFGDQTRGIAARRPRLAPNGTALVFESNVYDLAANDNPRRTYQLYYVPVRTEQDGPAAELHYQPPMLVMTGSARLTEGSMHASGAAWLASPVAPGRGEIVFTQSTANYRVQKVMGLAIDGAGGPTELRLEAGGSMLDEDVRVLDARRSSDGVTKKILVERSWAHAGDTSLYELSPPVLSDVVRVKVTYDPPADCWDHNGNGTVDGRDEDVDGDGQGTVEDCSPEEIRGLYVVYDALLAAHELTQAEPGAVIEGPPPGGLAKVVELANEAQGSAEMVRIDVVSIEKGRPIPAGTEIVTLVFTPLGPSGDAGTFTLAKRETASAVYVKTIGGSAELVDTANYLRDTKAGAFAPDGRSVLLSGYSQARPALVRVGFPDNPQDPMELARVGAGASLIESLSVRRQEQLMACNWVGAYRDRYTGMYRGAFRGGLDELILYSYVRGPGAIRSEAERGREWLKKAGRDGTLPARAPICSRSDVECPPYMMCNYATQRCETVSCATAPCERGLCTARPISAKTDRPEIEWVCTAECVTDTECFTHQCLNGPCRFCDEATSSCVECRSVVTNVGSGLPPEWKTEGCPDRNSYSCEDGNCYSECVSFENNESRYLCESPVEFCQHGRCVLASWSWANLAPATFCGAGEMYFENQEVWSFSKVATSTAIKVEIQAYGSSDFLRMPHMLIEGCRRGDGYCFEIGEVAVDNRTKDLERTPKYVLYTPWRFDTLRLRLVVPPHDNLTGGATGWLGDQRVFCTPGGGTPDPCTNQAPGSLYTMGYPAQVPDEVIAKAAGTVDGDPARAYLRPGLPGVIVRGVVVQGTSYPAPSHNPICSYEGETTPYEEQLNPETLQVERRWRRMFYGTSELSHHRTRFCDERPCSSSWGLVDLEAEHKPFAVLNCAYAQGTEIAAAEYAVVLSEPREGNVSETGNTCQYPDGTLCYEWEYRPTFDVFNAEVQLFHTLDFDDFGSLGSDTPSQ